MKLIYFNGPGRAEISRLILAHAKVDFEDERIEISKWPAIKASMSPPATVPILELENGVQIRQSLAIAKYLAREYGLAGASNLEMAFVEQVMDTMAIDVQNSLYKVTFFRDPIKTLEQVKEETKENITPSMNFVESVIKKPFVLGDKISAADLMILVIIRHMEASLESFFSAGKFPKMAAVIEGVKTVPQIKAWQEKH